MQQPWGRAACALLILSSLGACGTAAEDDHDCATAAAELAAREAAAVGAALPAADREVMRAALAEHRGEAWVNARCPGGKPAPAAAPSTFARPPLPAVLAAEVTP